MFDKRETLKVKGIAICMLLFHHLFYSSQRINAGGLNVYLIPMEWLTKIGTGMRLCVWVFAFLSAYGLTKQYLAMGEKPTGKQRICFVYKRWLSTMKPYWLIFALVTLIAAVAYRDPLALYKGSILDLLLSGLALSDLFGATMPVAAWWYMSMAVLLIVLMPVFVELCRKVNWFALPAVFLLTPYLGSGISSKFGGSYWNYLMAVFLAILCAKNGTLDKCKNGKDSFLLRFMKGIALLAGIVVCVGINMKFASIDTWRLTKVFMALASFLLCVFSYTCLTGRFIEKLLAFLGKHSGNIFLIHAFTYTYWIHLTYWSHNVVGTFLTVLLASLACSVLCQYLYKSLCCLTARCFNRTASVK